MTAAEIECNADLGHPCDAGEDGDPCPSCKREANYWRDRYLVASKQERSPSLYAREMIDAGRGHLLTIAERGAAS